MEFSSTKENGLESLIVRWLVERNGYEQGTNTNYNREYAVDETRLFRLPFLIQAKNYQVYM